MLATESQGGDRRYWDALAEGRLELPRCAACGRWHWPAVWRCGDCGSWDHVWTERPLAGEVFTWTRTWHRFPGTEELPLPFVTAVVALPGLPVRLAGIVEGDDSAIEIGTPVAGRIASTLAFGRSIPALRWRRTT